MTAFAPQGFCRTFNTLLAPAVILGVLGGLCPLLPAGLVEELPGDLKAMISPLGFVLFGLAAGAILLDQAFGYSSAWMRSRLTEAELSKLIWSFEIEVRGALNCAADTLSGDDAKAILGRVSQFAAALSGHYRPRDPNLDRREQGGPSANRTNHQVFWTARRRSGRIEAGLNGRRRVLNRAIGGQGAVRG